MTKNIKFVIIRFVFSSSNAPKSVFQPPPIPLPVRCLRRLELGAVGSQAPSTQNPGYATVVSRIYH